jgi:hypothetical protein
MFSLDYGVMYFYLFKDDYVAYSSAYNQCSTILCMWKSRDKQGALVGYMVFITQTAPQELCLKGHRNDTCMEPRVVKPCRFILILML